MTKEEIFFIREHGTQLESKRILSLLKTILPNVEIYEIGSTAVEGVIGKGDLDFLGRSEEKDFQHMIGLLDRHFERDTQQFSDSMYQAYIIPSSFDAKLQCTVKDGPYDTFLNFIDILKRHPSIQEEYNALKRQWHGHPMELYRQAKAEFINRMLRDLG